MQFSEDAIKRLITTMVRCANLLNIGQANLTKLLTWASSENF